MKCTLLVYKLFLSQEFKEKREGFLIMKSEIKEIRRKYFFYFVEGCLDQLDNLEIILKRFSRKERIEIFYETITKEMKILK